MTMRISTAIRNALCDAAVDSIDSGAGTAKLQLWSGSVPAQVTDTPAGTKLAEFDLPNPAFGASAAGVATANAISDVVGLAAGTVGFARVVDRDGTGLWDNDDVGTSGTQIVLNTLTISVGLDVSVSSWLVQMPAS